MSGSDASRLAATWTEPARPCPGCGEGRTSGVFAPMTIDPARVSAFSYAARKVPELMSYELVRCAGCELVYAPQPPPPEVLELAYADAAFDTPDEAARAAHTYARALSPELERLRARPGFTGHALDIGTGTGAFLEQLQGAGFAHAEGVEPSHRAIESAAPALRASIRHGGFDSRGYAASSFDLVSCFQTLEHVPEPSELVAGAFRALRPGGIMAVVAHDHSALLNRVLGRRSPIVDIEHLQLFHPKSLEALLSKIGFEHIAIRPLANAYRLDYWLRLVPVGQRSRAFLLGAARRLGMAEKVVKARVGNMLGTAVKGA